MGPTYFSIFSFLSAQKARTVYCCMWW